jgi:enamine deaminase RidA (YjgF/YER057c/UK114 family)
MKTRLVASLFGALFSALLASAAPTRITMPAEASSPISAGVGLPAGRALFWTSGTVPAPINKDGKTVHERFGDTHAQGVSALKNIAHVLIEQGLSMKDIVYLRVYVASDLEKDGKPDFAGWFKAYGEFFNNEKNPIKTARSTVGVSALVSSDWLIEIEAFAAYPLEK